jgi:hypothetical protein
LSLRDVERVEMAPGASLRTLGAGEVDAWVAPWRRCSTKRLVPARLGCWPPAAIPSPTARYSAYPWNPNGSRQVDYRYFRQLAEAYDHLGYTGALFATGAHDVWVLAGALMPFTERLKFLIAIHPGLVPVTLLGKMAATLQEFSGGLRPKRQ